MGLRGTHCEGHVPRGIAENLNSEHEGLEMGGDLSIHKDAAAVDDSAMLSSSCGENIK